MKPVTFPNNLLSVLMTALSLAILGASPLMTPGTAVAQDAEAAPLAIQVHTVHALPGGQSMDTSLSKEMAATLQKAFDGYGTFKDLGVQKAEVALTKAHTFTLKDGTELTLTYKGPSKELVRLGLAVGEKFKSDVRASHGVTFYQAGLPYEGGILIIAITVQ